MTSNYKENMAFENEVRIVAEAVWQLSPGDCLPEHYPDSPVVKELDGIARLRDITHLIMVTTSRKLDKAKSDIKKLNAAEKQEQKSNPVAIAKWFITRDILDAEHLLHAKKNNVTALTLDQFRRKFFNGNDYLFRRLRAPFGSARNPSDNSVTIADNAYVSVPIKEVKTATTRKGGFSHDETTYGESSVQDIVRLLIDGNIVVLTGSFGAGKSLSAREIFKKLSNTSNNESLGITPIYLNLREHWGQSYFDEMLERHARSIGYKHKEELVMAWRASMCCLILDGFDEVEAQTVIRLDDRNFMRDARYRAMEGVRDFLTKIPAGVGVLLCGRDHYFDSSEEMTHALGLSLSDYQLFQLDEFTEENANEFLIRNGLSGPLPDWLPRKPLLLSYLAQNRLFDEILQIDSSKGFAHAWDSFIDQIANREASLEKAVMDPASIKRVMERLSHIVRGTQDGTGPITGNDLSTAFILETGQNPQEGVLAQLQRLPGLTQRDQDPSKRSFIDQDMLSALQGNAFCRLMLGDLQQPENSTLEGLHPKGISMASHQLRRNGATLDTAISLAHSFSDKGKNSADYYQFAADAIRVAIDLAEDSESRILDFRGLFVRESNFQTLDLTDLSVKGISLADCIVSELSLNAYTNECDIRLSDCIIGKLNGASNEASLPDNIRFSNCEIQKYDAFATNNAVMRLEITPGMKAIITILRKVFLQSGSGRQMSALRRGISTDVDRCIPAAIDRLISERIIFIENDIVHPIRSQTARVRKIVDAPMLSDDSLIADI